MRNTFEFIHVWQICTGAATRGVLRKKMFLKVSQNSQENTCARVSFEEHLLNDCFWLQTGEPRRNIEI